MLKCLLGMLAVSPKSMTTPSLQRAASFLSVDDNRLPLKLSAGPPKLTESSRASAKENPTEPVAKQKALRDSTSSHGTRAVDAAQATVAKELETSIRAPGTIIKVKSGSKARRKSKGTTGDNGQGRITGTKITRPKGKTKIVEAKVYEPLGLDAAIPRRTDWTPPKPKHTAHIDLTDNGGQAIDAEDGELSLQGVLGRFRYAPSAMANSAGTGKSEALKQPPLKRRKLEMLEPPSLSTSTVTTTAEKGKKAKATRKKAQTITELATRDFVPVDKVANPSLIEGFLSQMPSKDTDQNRDAKLADALDDPQSRKRAKISAAADSSKTAKSRLLSPEKAIEAAESQEILFGTSSQLVREDSPSFIRDLQYALRESEASASQGEMLDSQGKKSSTEGSLWNAATRDLDGSLLAAETVDLTTTPRLLPSRQTNGQGAFHTTPSLLAPLQKVATPELNPSEELNSALQATGAPTVPQLEDEPRRSLPKSMAEAACRVRPRSQSPVKKSRTRKSAREKDESDFNTWTVAELSKKIKGYGFKPVKRKAAMVALLEKCRDSLNKSSAQKTAEESVVGNSRQPKAQEDGSPEVSRSSKEHNRTVSNKNIDKVTHTTPKKRGRPRKADIAVQDSSTPDKAAKRVKKKKVTSSLETLPDVVLVTSSPRAAALSATARPAVIGTEPVKGPAVPASAATSRDPHHGLGLEPASSAPLPTRLAPPSAAPAAGPAAEDEGKHDTDTAQSSSSDPNARLLAAITQAVTNSPPTHDPQNLTWHEKMLMYDPIVLEDLAVWLNTEGLARVGVDDEVWPTLVRQWCEERSVCCLWRENLRGGKRARY